MWLELDEKKLLLVKDKQQFHVQTIKGFLQSLHNVREDVANGGSK
jgi:hypothetical protein